MARTKNGLGTAIIVILLFILLYALNPSTDDFRAWRSARAEGQATGGQRTGLVGALRSGSGKLAGAVDGAIAGLYERKDYLICSIYYLGNDCYLGVAHIFIRLK
jgi:hypothetical protein